MARLRSGPFDLAQASLFADTANLRPDLHAVLPFPALSCVEKASPHPPPAPRWEPWRLACAARPSRPRPAQPAGWVRLRAKLPPVRSSPQTPGPAPARRGRRLRAERSSWHGRTEAQGGKGVRAESTVEASKTRGRGTPGQRGGQTCKCGRHAPGRRRSNLPFRASPASSEFSTRSLHCFYNWETVVWLIQLYFLAVR